MAVLRRASAAIHAARSTTAPPRAAAIHRAGSAAAPPRAAASIHPAGSTAAPPRAAASIHPAGSAAAPPRAAAIHRAGSAAAPPRTAASIYLASLSRLRAPTGISRFGASAGHLAAARFGASSDRLATATTPTGVRLMHMLVARPIDPHIQIELSRLDARGFLRYKEIAEAIQRLRLKHAGEEAVTMQYLIEHIIHVGTVSWRVCTTALTVAVAAGIGVLQLSKSDWETEFHQSSCSLMTSRLAETKVVLEEYMLREITHRRNVAVANAFLENEQNKERFLELEERESALVATEAAVVAKEAVLVEKDAPLVSFWRGMLPWSG